MSVPVGDTRPAYKKNGLPFTTRGANAHLTVENVAERSRTAAIVCGLIGPFALVIGVLLLASNDSDGITAIFGGLCALAGFVWAKSVVENVATWTTNAVALRAQAPNSPVAESGTSDT